jgi:hypothetical protein
VLVNVSLMVADEPLPPASKMPVSVARVQLKAVPLMLLVAV